MRLIQENYVTTAASRVIEPAVVTDPVSRIALVLLREVPCPCNREISFKTTSEASRPLLSRCRYGPLWGQDQFRRQLAVRRTPLSGPVAVDISNGTQAPSGYFWARSSPSYERVAVL